MCHVCAACGGKRWVWNGHARVVCSSCGGTGRPTRYEDRPRGPMPEVEDPAKQRSSGAIVRDQIDRMLASLPAGTKVIR